MTALFYRHKRDVCTSLGVSIDLADNKWGLGLVGSNDTTGGACWFCYSHNSYYAEVPEKFLKNSHGQYIDHSGNIVNEKNAVKSPQYEDVIKIWGEPKYKGDNPSVPILVTPMNVKKGDRYDQSAF